MSLLHIILLLAYLVIVPKIITLAATIGGMYACFPSPRGGVRTLTLINCKYTN